MSAAEDSSEGPVTNPSISFLLRQVYYAHRKQVKELENEIVTLKQMINKQKKNDSVPPCEECKKMKTFVAEQEQKILLLEQKFGKTSEIKHQFSERSIGVQTDRHLETSQRTFWKKRSHSNGLPTAKKRTKCVSSVHIKDDEDGQPASSRSKDLCRVPSIRESNVLVPETLTIEPQVSFQDEHSQNVTIAHIAETLDDQRNFDAPHDKSKLGSENSIKAEIVTTSSREINNIVNPVSLVKTVSTSILTSTQKSFRTRLSKSKLQLPISSKSAVQHAESKEDSEKEIFSPSPIRSSVLQMKGNTRKNVTSNPVVSQQNIPLDDSPSLLYCKQQEEMYDICKNKNDVISELSATTDNFSVQEPQDFARIQPSTPALFETKKENLSLDKLSKKLKLTSKYMMELQPPPNCLKKSKLKQTRLSATSFNPPSKDLTKIKNFSGGLRTVDKALNESVDRSLNVYQKELSKRNASYTSGWMSEQIQETLLPKNLTDSKLDETLLPQEESGAVLNQVENRNMNSESLRYVWEVTGEAAMNWNGSIDPAVCLTDYESSMTVNVGTCRSKGMKVPVETESDHEEVVLNDRNQESYSESESSEDLLSAMSITTPQKTQPEQAQ
ncbi:uncharacterized protein LOC106475966, partial [Limulus polyphemus]|uniref:Uncharacterized protein LOC106475966 n=1 Tax=Limulus polyphemus TaxID=6850 RepID=A0ABM1C0H9_LIMPO